MGVWFNIIIGTGTTTLLALAHFKSE
jgi:hypothetical protein